MPSLVEWKQVKTVASGDVQTADSTIWSIHTMDRSGLIQDLSLFCKLQKGGFTSFCYGK